MTDDHSGISARTRIIDLPGICWRQFRAERRLRREGIEFRSTDPEQVRDAYSRMSAAEFDAINGRNAWANTRTLRKSLAGLLPARPVRVIDLGSGTGASTAALAGLVPPSSDVLGIEFASSLVNVARDRSHRASEEPGRGVRFAVGSISETFADETGRPLPAESVELVNAVGILGHHLDLGEIERCLDEVARVLVPGGIAALDVGPKLSSETLTSLMRRRGFGRLRRTRSQPFDRTGQVVFEKGSAAGV